MLNVVRSKAKHAAPSKTKHVLIATSAFALISAGLAVYVTQSPPDADASGRQKVAVSGIRPAAGGPGGDVNGRRRPPRPSKSPSATPAPTLSPTPTPAPKPTPPKPQPSTPAPKPPPPPPPARSDLPAQLLAHINKARAAEGLPPYTMTDGLNRAATRHSELMAGDCGMSHLCPGEASMGDRIKAEGVTWRSAGENVGYGTAANNPTAILNMAKQLTDSMLAETPPNDGHRRNLLSTSFKFIGISILRDGSGKVWLTQDFTG